MSQAKKMELVSQQSMNYENKEHKKPLFVLKIETITLLSLLISRSNATVVQHYKYDKKRRL